MEPRTKSFLMWSGIICLCFFGIPFHLKGEEQEHLELALKNYSTTFGKSYDDRRFKDRLPHFKKSLQKISELNARDDESIWDSESPNLKLSSGNDLSDDERDSARKHVHGKKWRPGMPKNEGFAVWGLTELADMSPEEFSLQYLSPTILQKIEERERSHKDSHHHHHSHHDNHVRRRRALSIPGPLPEKVDWRTKGVISPVKHQKSCGACWAFSTVETVESMNAILKGNLQTLSIQQVIDCATNGNMGCNGGDTCAAVDWMTGQRLALETEYPLTLVDGTCKLRASPSGIQVNANYTCDNYVGAENDLLTVLAHHGPVAVAVDATNWQYYVGGVIQWNCDANNNHAVQIVGYDQTATPPHYIVRNSWGTTYGDGGYMYIAIGSNLCGIAREVSSLSVK
ncbi:Cathepsin O [Orchesella cincta]|uniref:Cathepsin O n=1 Tax=Orchesella cincta TaxID=48709 RepID=A0A1D2MWW1_ORCCI|nr:Cathepsin O [Orchesella cincta]